MHRRITFVLIFWQILYVLSYAAQIFLSFSTKIAAFPWADLLGHVGYAGFAVLAVCYAKNLFIGMLAISFHAFMGMMLLFSMLLQYQLSAQQVLTEFSSHLLWVKNIFDFFMVLFCIGNIVFLMNSLQKRFHVEPAQ